MNTEKATTITASARPENVPVSWELWHSMLTPDQEHQVALETGFAQFGGGYDETKMERFEALVDFRRSMKLFHHYAKQVNP